MSLLERLRARTIAAIPIELDSGEKAFVRKLSAKDALTFSGAMREPQGEGAAAALDRLALGLAAFVCDESGKCEFATLEEAREAMALMSQAEATAIMQAGIRANGLDGSGVDSAEKN